MLDTVPIGETSLVVASSIRISRCWLVVAHEHGVLVAISLLIVSVTILIEHGSGLIAAGRSSRRLFVSLRSIFDGLIAIGGSLLSRYLFRRLLGPYEVPDPVEQHIR